MYELRKWNKMKNDPRSCERNLCNYEKKPEKKKKRIQDFNGGWTRWENIWTHNWPDSHVGGFIAQLVSASHRYREVMGSHPVEVLFFFSASFNFAIT